MRINHLVFPSIPSPSATSQTPQGKPLAGLSATPAVATQPKKSLDTELQTGMQAESKNLNPAQPERSPLRATALAGERPNPAAKPSVKTEPASEPLSRVIYTPADPSAKKALLDKIQAPVPKLVKALAEPTKSESVSDLSLEGQLEMGKKMGLFTHITISKDGVLSARPERAKTVASQEFVSSAVTTMKDFADGIALLKQNTGSPVVASKAQATDAVESTDLVTSRPSPFQQIAARLNLFA